MDLDQFLSRPDAPSVSELRTRMIALGYNVKSDAQIRQWRHGYADRIPSPENCVGLEKATAGKVSRKTFHPTDWHLIWPELVRVPAEAA
jgi:DNA-binding transcriptional regulator YdaS (Cro superfamily)